MSFNFISFASGSKGNCSMVFTENTAIVIDAGISLKKLTQELKNLGKCIEDVKGVVVTHEHSDHVANICKYGMYVPVYAHLDTHVELFTRYDYVEQMGEVDDFMEGFTIGDIEVKPFEIPHDANAPVGYSFFAEGKQISIATDMGEIRSNVFQSIKDSNILLLEANHDLNMLIHGPYPAWLKKRVKGSHGHLSNIDSAKMACMIKRESNNLHDLILGHISQENNIPELALNTVKGELEKEGLLGDTIVSVASQHTPTKVFEA